MEVSIAAAEAVKLARRKPSPLIRSPPNPHREHLSELVANGELDAEFVPGGSEHSAMSVCAGTSAVGARTIPPPAPGLALMSEILYIVSGMRLPVVMSVANRPCRPLSIWNDHSDIIPAGTALDPNLHRERPGSVRPDDLRLQDCGRPRVLIPTIVNLDGFTLSHVVSRSGKSARRWWISSSRLTSPFTGSTRTSP